MFWGPKETPMHIFKGNPMLDCMSVSIIFWALYFICETDMHGLY